MMSSGSSSRNARTDALLASLPLCMVTLNPENLHPIEINEAFRSLIGPLYKFKHSPFISAACDEKNSDARLRLRAAIEEAKKMQPKRCRARNIEMLTLAGESGFPVHKFFDWFISCTSSTDDEDVVILLGDPCTDQDVTQREKDAELIDFFQNAPIAMHWLSGEGKVLWANQTELNVLGYTAEEYIGQDIMKFCDADEKDLVLNIFKQLGSGNAIKDVPVRFRAKDGKVVDLLIDSNVKYEKDGSFGHTRCFIRDDTGRKIREARASLLLEETKRSLKMLDNFMARSLHHIRTPLHVVQIMIDSIGAFLKTDKVLNCPETTECEDMVQMTENQIRSTVALLDDVADLAKFDQGAVLKLEPTIVNLEDFGKELLSKAPASQSGVELLLEIRQSGMNEDGPSRVILDPSVLLRALMNLLKNAVEVTSKGAISICIGYKNHRLTFAVQDTGPGLDRSCNAADGDLPGIFQRYHQELIPDEISDLEDAKTLRDRIESGINTHRKNGIGIGLSLTYHLVQSLGGELRCTSKKRDGAIFYFSFPTSVSTDSRLQGAPVLMPALFDKAALAAKVGGIPLPTQLPLSMPTPEVTQATPPSKLASEGIKSQDPPSVLVVEDTKACAKMLCRILTKLGCAVEWAENGQIAVDLLTEAMSGTYDLILMDLRMPVMDGLEATSIIKTELKLDTPVIALTGDDNQETRQKTKEIGFDAFYGKPTKRDDLKAAIHQFCGSQT